MAGSLPGDSSLHGMVRNAHDSSHDNQEEVNHSGARWYFSRKEIEENSPSRRDGIDLKKETYLRKSYCTFLQDLGMRLKVPQVTIATAIVFCHRFFLHQSHAKNDRRTIATVCMFLAGKVEETPRPLKDVILVSYEIIHKKDPSAVQKIKQKEVYEQQKELILLGERVVLATLGFDLNVHHPYKPLVEAIKKFKVAQNALAQVAWNFVNDGLRTSLCLQFKPHHIAAGAIFLAAKFLKVKLPSDGEKVWWQEFDVTPRQLEDVSNQMLELYEQNRTLQSSHASEVEGSTGTNHPVATASSASETAISSNSLPQAGGIGNLKQGSQVLAPSRLVGTQSHPDNRVAPNKSIQNQSNDNGSVDGKSGVSDHNMDSEGKDCLVNEVEPHSSIRENMTEASSNLKSTLQRPVADAVVNRDEGSLSKLSSTSDPDSRYEAAKGYYPPDAITKIDKDKVKAALEKRRKLRNDVTKKTDLMDEDDLIERELENGIELVVEGEKTKQERRQSWPKSLNQQAHSSQSFELDQAGIRDLRNCRVSEQQLLHSRNKPRSFDAEGKVIPDHCVEQQVENAEEGELSSLDEHEYPSPKLHRSNEEALSTRNQDHDFPQSVRKMSGTGRTNHIQNRCDEHEFPSQKQVNEKITSTGRQFEGKQQQAFPHHRETSGVGRMEYVEREQKRLRHEFHG